MSETTYVFDQWPLEEILAICRDTVEDPDYPTVRRWREQGGKVVGHFQVYFPQEIAHAAGALPLQLQGHRSSPTWPIRASAPTCA